MITIYKSNAPALAGGLNGWFGRMVKKLVNAAIGLVGEFPIIGGAIANELHDLVSFSGVMEGDFFQRSAPEFEPSPAEAAIIENWATTKLNPFYKAMVSQLSNAFANPNFDIQLAEINNVILKICVLKQYYATYETTGLSADAVKSRMEVITTILLPLENLIAKSIAQYETVVNLTPYVFASTATNATQFMPLIARLGALQFNCNKYVATNTPNIAPVRPTTTPIKTLPVKGNTVLPVGQTPTKPVTQTPTTPAVQTPTTPASTSTETKPTTPVEQTPIKSTTPVTDETPTADEKKPKYLLWFLGGLLAAKSLQIIFRNKE